MLESTWLDIARISLFFAPYNNLSNFNLLRREELERGIELTK